MFVGVYLLGCRNSTFDNLLTIIERFQIHPSMIILFQMTKCAELPINESWYLLAINAVIISVRKYRSLPTSFWQSQKFVLWGYAPENSFEATLRPT